MSITIKFTGPAFFLENIEILTFISMMVELIRRTVWALLRVENEFFNNFEKFRDDVLIPTIKEEDDNI